MFDQVVVHADQTGARFPPRMQQAQLQQAMAMTLPNAPLTAVALAVASPSVQKRMIGEKLFPVVEITGMLLEPENNELLVRLDKGQQLKSKVVIR